MRLCQATRDVTSSLGWTTREARRPDRPDHLGAPTRGRDLPGGRRGHLGEARHGSTSRTAMRPTTRYRPFDRDRHSEETNSSETSRASATKHDGATPRATPRARGRARRGAQTSGKGREPTGGRSRGSRRADARGTRSRELEELTTLAGWRSHEVEKSRRSWDDNPTSKDLGDEGPETQKVPRGPRGASRLVLYLGRSLSLEESALYIEPWRSSRRSGLKASRTPERFATRQFLLFFFHQTYYAEPRVRAPPLVFFASVLLPALEPSLAEPPTTSEPPEPPEQVVSPWPCRTV
jgi:hypothetical protein